MNNKDELKGASILLVDDAPENLDLLRRILEPANCQIFFATTGEMALDVASRTVPDIILLDVMMPGMDGFETCIRLRDNPALGDVPVIFVTAKTDVVDLAKGFEVGGVDYVTKPVKPLEVVARVGAHLKIKRLIEEQRRHLDQLEQARKELQELNATKDRFLSNIGQSVQVSLSDISAASALIKESITTGESSHRGFSQRLSEVNQSAEHLLRLLEHILEWPRVQTGQKLDLFDTEITDREFAFLIQRLEHLRFLSLADTEISNAGLVHLRALEHLQELHLDNTHVTDAGLEQIAALKSLRVLDLKGTRITDAGLAHLRPLVNLRGLYLTRTPITDAGLAHVAQLLNLETLILWETAVSDEGLAHLRPLTKLTELILWETEVTEEGAAALQSALPNCEVSTNMFA